MAFINYGFIDGNISSPCTTSNFIKKYGDIVEEIIENPESKIFLTDFGGGIPLARFLSKKFYRNGVLYHVGDKPRFNICNFSSLRGGFLSQQECQLQIERDCVNIYKM